MRRPRIDNRCLAKALLLFVLLMGLFLPAFALYDRFDAEVRRSRADFAAAQIANRFAQILLSRLEVISMFTYVIPALHLDTYEDFAGWAARIEQNLPGFQALNYVNAAGYVKWIVPDGPNRSALGKLVTGRPDVGPYLAASRDTRQPQLTHIVGLYQGNRGIVLYHPIYEGNTFKGWLNGVFAVDQIIGDLLVTPEFSDIYFRLEFKGHPGSVYEHGQSNHDRREVEGYTELKILNQTIGVTVRFVPTDGRTAPLDTLRWLIVFGVVATSALLSAFAYFNMRAKERIKERLEKEHMQGVLLNLLVHDIVNPLLIVRFAADAAGRHATPEVAKELAKIDYAVKQLNGVLMRVKDMRAVELGKIRLVSEAVHVNDIIADSLKLFEARFKEKGIEADFRLSTVNPMIMVDRVSFQNNVINNVISNAVKFTDAGGKVIMHTYERAKEVVIEISDTGIGMVDEVRRSLFLENVDVTKPGTMGERGTGIGMLQVKSYMRMFGGHVVVHSRPKATVPHDHGTTLCLYMPKPVPPKA